MFSLALIASDEQNVLFLSFDLNKYNLYANSRKKLLYDASSGKMEKRDWNVRLDVHDPSWNTYIEGLKLCIKNIPYASKLNIHDNSFSRKKM